MVKSVPNMQKSLLTGEDLSSRIRILAQHQALQVLAKLAADRRLQVYLVGGTVRELLLGREIHDLDLAVDRQTLDLAETLAAALGGTFVLLDDQERSARVVWQGQELDLTEFRASDLPGDLRKRDFTLNAMAIDLQDLYKHKDPEIIDPWGGGLDLAAGRLQVLLPENFRKDPLRLLRAFRFAASHGFELTPEVQEAVKRYGGAIAGTAGERIHQELFRLLAAPRAYPVLRQMEELGFLSQILPELADMKGVLQNGYHHLDVFEHSLTAVGQLEEVLAGPEAFFKVTSGYVTDYARQEKKPALLKLAALFHDAGKPPTQEFREDQERYTFYHHERLGMEIFQGVAARVRLSQEETRTVTRLIELHMRPFLLLPDYKQGKLSQRALGRFIKAARPELPGVFLLAMADSLAGQGALKPPDAEAVLADFCDQAYFFLKERVEPLEQRPRLLTGDDLIQELGLEPGPEFRRLLTAVEEAALEGRIHNREEALVLVRGLTGSGKRES
jgi:poly(A) polymerase